MLITSPQSQTWCLEIAWDFFLMGQTEFWVFSLFFKTDPINPTSKKCLYNQQTFFYKLFNLSVNLLYSISISKQIICCAGENWRTIGLSFNPGFVFFIVCPFKQWCVEKMQKKLELILTKRSWTCNADNAGLTMCFDLLVVVFRSFVFGPSYISNMHVLCI